MCVWTELARECMVASLGTTAAAADDDDEMGGFLMSAVHSCPFSDSCRVVTCVLSRNVVTVCVLLAYTSVRRRQSDFSILQRNSLAETR